MAEETKATSKGTEATAKAAATGKPASSAGKGVAVLPRPLAFPDVRAEIDRLWEAVAGPWRPFAGFTREPVIPATDVFESGGQLHVRTELPGLAAEDVEISATADTLTISGEKTQRQEVKEKDYYRSERTYGKFSRQIALPEGANVEKASARFKDGVLEVDVPVGGKSTRKRIEIKPA